MRRRWRTSHQIIYFFQLLIKLNCLSNHVPTFLSNGTFYYELILNQMTDKMIEKGNGLHTPSTRISSITTLYSELRWVTTNFSNSFHLFLGQWRTDFHWTAVDVVRIFLICLVKQILRTLPRFHLDDTSSSRISKPASQWF